MKIIQKKEYKPDEMGMIDYPIGHKFEINGYKYIVNRSTGSCDECDFKNKKYCDLVYCSRMRDDKKEVIFKRI